MANETNKAANTGTQNTAAPSTPAKPWDGKTKVISVSVTNGPKVEVNAPDFETLEQARRKVDDDTALVALINQAYTVALQAGARRVLQKEYKTDAERKTAVQQYVDGYIYGVRATSGDGVKRVSVDKVKATIQAKGVKFSEAQLEALKAAGIEF